MKDVCPKDEPRSHLKFEHLMLYLILYSKEHLSEKKLLSQLLLTLAGEKLQKSKTLGF
jgi:hypothetical protein